MQIFIIIRKKFFINENNIILYNFNKTINSWSTIGKISSYKNANNKDFQKLNKIIKLIKIISSKNFWFFMYYYLLIFFLFDYTEINILSF